MAALESTSITGAWSPKIKVNEMSQYWKSQPTPLLPVCAFHGHTKGTFKCFSNFYERNFMTFRIPDCCWSDEFNAKYSQTVEDVAFSEKSIMLCKAALFRDHEAYAKIKLLEYPVDCKHAGRQVRNFNQTVWSDNILTIAYEVVFQKFSQSKLERDILMSTNDSLIVEASPTDKIWGVGAHCSDSSIQDPKLWRGTNILGWALMEARNSLRSKHIINEVPNKLNQHSLYGETTTTAAAVPTSSRQLKSKDLMQHWKTIPARSQPVCGFYGHSKNNQFRCFSNFYEQPQPTTFIIPDCCWSLEFEESDEHPNRIIENITFSEKSIMLCKAALFRDHEAYAKIKTLKSAAKVKQAGRAVRNFDGEIWSECVCEIAFQAVYQKFSQLTYERGVLLSTGEALITEASPGDHIWGIGVGTDHPSIQDPKLWRGTNILGWALMEARAQLVSEL